MENTVRKIIGSVSELEIIFYSSVTVILKTLTEIIFCCRFIVGVEANALMRLYLALGVICLLASVLAKEDKKEKDEVGTVIGIDLGTTYSW